MKTIDNFMCRRKKSLGAYQMWHILLGGIICVGDKAVDRCLVGVKVVLGG